MPLLFRQLIPDTKTPPSQHVLGVLQWLFQVLRPPADEKANMAQALTLLSKQPESSSHQSTSQNRLNTSDTHDTPSSSPPSRTQGQYDSPSAPSTVSPALTDFKMEQYDPISHRGSMQTPVALSPISQPMLNTLLALFSGVVEHFQKTGRLGDSQMMSLLLPFVVSPFRSVESVSRRAVMFHLLDEFRDTPTLQARDNTDMLLQLLRMENSFDNMKTRSLPPTPSSTDNKRLNSHVQREVDPCDPPGSKHVLPFARYPRHRSVSSIASIDTLFSIILLIVQSTFVYHETSHIQPARQVSMEYCKLSLNVMLYGLSEKEQAVFVVDNILRSSPERNTITRAPRHCTAAHPHPYHPHALVLSSLLRLETILSKSDHVRAFFITDTITAQQRTIDCRRHVLELADSPSQTDEERDEELQVAVRRVIYAFLEGEDEELDNDRLSIKWGAIFISSLWELYLKQPYPVPVSSAIPPRPPPGETPTPAPAPTPSEPHILPQAPSPVPDAATSAPLPVTSPAQSSPPASAVMVLDLSKSNVITPYSIPHVEELFVPPLGFEIVFHATLRGLLLFARSHPPDKYAHIWLNIFNQLFMAAVVRNLPEEDQDVFRI
ncbi:hypothetical protein BLNAU_15174 [Blattamonas nauphoetae]|uniref:Dymeclin n=1 Tax=Blattamonas nauphoetae TaxID=2049346 RepID=A0ABQ9XHW4_9EUKA|nr:hypothetical protein BLNAU_15174 [Blattamonas nauphoetae]